MPNDDIQPDGEDISEEEEEKSMREKIKEAWHWVVKNILTFIDLFTKWLEKKNTLYREVVEVMLEDCNASSSRSLSVNKDLQEGVPESVDDQQQQQLQQQQSQERISVVDEDEVQSREGTTIKHSATRLQLSDSAAIKGGANFKYNRRRDIENEIHMGPSGNTPRETDECEVRPDQTNIYSQKISRLFQAIGYSLLSRSDFLVYFFVIVNIILNGSSLDSFFFAVLLYCCGLLSTPWPSKLFWWILILSSIGILFIKYLFQFKSISYWKYHFDEKGGLYPPYVLGIQYQNHFVSKAMWNVVMLFALLLHRVIMKVSSAV